MPGAYLGTVGKEMAARPIAAKLPVQGPCQMRYFPIMTRQTILSALLVGTLATGAQASNVIKANYVVEAAGTTVMRADYTAELGENGFSSSLSGKTAGISNMLKGAKVDMQASGGFDGGTFTPGNFQNTKKKKHKDAKSTGLNWTDSGTVALITDDGPKALPDGVQNALSKPSSDPLTAILNMTHMGAAKPCTGKHRIYDGKDVYDLSLAFKKLVTVGENKQTAMKCRVTYTPVAGKSFDAGERDVDGYDAVFVPLTLGDKQPRYFPVELVGRTMGVTYTIRAQSLEIDGQPQAVTLAE
jgi:Protein of unknown function (DUF3108)